MTNPLLNITNTPDFTAIKPEHILPAIQQTLTENRAEITQLLDSQQTYTWENLIEPLNEIDDRLNTRWSPVAHLNNVMDSEALREAYNHCLPLLSDYRSEIGQNKKMYAAYQAIANSPHFADLNPAQQMIIQNELRDFRLSGIDLPPEQQTRYREIAQQLSLLTTKFAQNLLDATHHWVKHITDETLLTGLPDTVKQVAANNAKQRNLTGWVLTLDAPCYLSCMNYLESRTLREELYTAYFTRASERDHPEKQWDNAPLMREIMALRQELAKLLGFEHYAEYSLYTKMAKKPEKVLDFLRDLAQRARPFAQRDLAQLQVFAEELYGVSELAVWDVPYYSEKLRLHQYAISQESLRPYFPLPHVLKGLFEIIRRLYGVVIKSVEMEKVWHSDVQFFEVYEEVSGQVRGYFYLDVYARASKRSGAWVGQCFTRKAVAATVRHPVSYVACNFMPPVGETPSLLTHQDVTTLFHEFGHALHNLLTKVDYSPISGTNGVMWDAVELPSQLMENWCWEREALDLLACHYVTGEKLPDDLFAKMLASKNFQAGLFMLRQLEFAIFDFRLHVEYQGDTDIQVLLNEVRQEVAVLIPPSFNRFQNSFMHIFAGGYAAGYYSYKWAEVLSADAFEKFKENGIFNPQVGAEFLREVLEVGGARDAMDAFVGFRGRAPDIGALLKQVGFVG